MLHMLEMVYHTHTFATAQCNFVSRNKDDSCIMGLKLTCTEITHARVA